MYRSKSDYRTRAKKKKKGLISNFKTNRLRRCRLNTRHPTPARRSRTSPNTLPQTPAAPRRTDRCPRHRSVATPRHRLGRFRRSCGAEAAADVAAATACLSRPLLSVRWRLLLQRGVLLPGALLGAAQLVQSSHPRIKFATSEQKVQASKYRVLRKCTEACGKENQLSICRNAKGTLFT